MQVELGKYQKSILPIMIFGILTRAVFSIGDERADDHMGRIRHCHRPGFDHGQISISCCCNWRRKFSP